MLTTLSGLLPVTMAYAAETPAAGLGSAMPQILLLGAFIGIFYFLIIRPQSKRAKAHKQLMASLSIGDEIATSGGLMGKITKVHDDAIELEIASNLSVHIQKGHVTAVLPKGTLSK